MTKGVPLSTKFCPNCILVAVQALNSFRYFDLAEKLFNSLFNSDNIFTEFVFTLAAMVSITRFVMAASIRSRGKIMKPGSGIFE